MGMGVQNTIAQRELLFCHFWNVVLEEKKKEGGGEKETKEEEKKRRGKEEDKEEEQEQEALASIYLNLFRTLRLSLRFPIIWP